MGTEQKLLVINSEHVKICKGAIIEKSLPEKQPAVAVNEFPSTWTPKTSKTRCLKKNSNLKILFAFTKHLKP